MRRGTKVKQKEKKHHAKQQQKQQQQQHFGQVNKWRVATDHDWKIATQL